MDFDQLPVTRKRPLPGAEFIKRVHEAYELLELPSRVTPNGRGVEMVNLPDEDDELAVLISEIFTRRFEIE
jgi:hypothetical protein